MTTHNLKTWPEYFQAIKSGKKTFEIRKNDRDFKVGDQLILDEYDPETNTYSGDHIHAFITWILAEMNPFIDLKGYAVMSIKLWEP